LVGPLQHSFNTRKHNGTFPPTRRPTESGVSSPLAHRAREGQLPTPNFQLPLSNAHRSDVTHAKHLRPHGSPLLTPRTAGAMQTEALPLGCSERPTCDVMVYATTVATSVCWYSQTAVLPMPPALASTQRSSRAHPTPPLGRSAPPGSRRRCPSWCPRTGPGDRPPGPPVRRCR
jgi:hypothetical protein